MNIERDLDDITQEYEVFKMLIPMMININERIQLD